MTTIGGNSGYIGYSMSKGAAEARANGSLPRKEFWKTYKIPQWMWPELRDMHAVTVDGWHHTSKFGNKTYFYSWLDDEVRDIWMERRLELINIHRMPGKQPRINKYPNTREGMDVFQKDWDVWHEKHKEAIGLIKDILLKD